MQCPRCGSDHIERASVIVERETQSIAGGGYVSGAGYVSTHGTSKSQRAQALTADEPRRNGCLGCLLELVLLSVSTIGIVLSCLQIAYVDYADVPVANPDFQRTQWTTWLVASVLVFIAIIVFSAIINRLRKNSFNRRHQSWYNLFYRRYYCNNCGNIMQL